MMDAKDLSYALVAALEDGDVSLLDGEDNAVGVDQARVFADANLLTTDDGLVLALDTGDTFQITIAKTASAGPVDEEAASERAYFDRLERADEIRGFHDGP